MKETQTLLPETRDELDDLPLQIMEADPTEQVRRESATYPMQAKEIAAAIVSDAGYDAAAAFLVAVKGFRKRVEIAFGPAVKKALEAYRAVLELRRTADAPLDEAEGILKPALAAWASAQDKKRFIERDRLIAEQFKKAAEERQAQAAEAKARGDVAAAKAVENAPPPALVLPAVEKATPEGISYREAWKVEVTDLRLLVNAIAQGTAPLAAVEANLTFLGQQARSLKAELSLPGVRVWSEKSVAVKGK